MIEERTEYINNGKIPMKVTKREKHLWETFQVLWDDDCGHLSSTYFMNLLTKDNTISYTKEESETFIDRLIKSKFLKPLNL